MLHDSGLALPRYVLKRDGKTTQDFDLSKIIEAIRGAWNEVYGKGGDEEIVHVAREAWTALVEINSDESALVRSVETIQNAVEVALMRAGRFDVARAYIQHRQRRADERDATKLPDPCAIAEYVHASKYARWREDLGRREVRDESVTRVEEMHLRRFGGDPWLAAEIKEAFDMVREKRVLPSMRSMQFGGAAVEKNHLRQYNCAFTLIDRPRAFSEALYLLLCGVGTGYSIQFCHVDKLPALKIQGSRVVHHIVEDTIEGWADAAEALVWNAILGNHVEFSYHSIRDRGIPLVTSGGLAPGHLPLRKALERAREILLGAQGRKLRPIECHRILCHFANAVLAGGIRRSAMIALFSPDDGEMLHCKAYREWYDREPWLSRANNTAVFIRSKVDEEQFRRIFNYTREYGEPGFALLDHPDHGLNPCAEVGLWPRILLDDTWHTGWAFCNLTTVNAAMLTSYEDFKIAARAACLIGTLQAAYTDFPYLGNVSEEIARRDALIGVSMTGMQDSPDVAMNYSYQKCVAKDVIVWNKIYADALGINCAARTTCLKPEGTGTLTLYGHKSPAVASGIGQHVSEKFIRHIEADEQEPVFRAFRDANPQACVRKSNNSWVIAFPVQVGEGAAVIDDTIAVDFLEQCRKTQLAWVLPGTVRGDLHHNVSCTIPVRDYEWKDVADYLWQYRADFTAVSFAPYDVSAVYAHAPFEAVRKPEQERRWRELVASYKAIDYLALREDGDNTTMKMEAACAGGACLV